MILCRARGDLLDLGRVLALVVTTLSGCSSTPPPAPTDAGPDDVDTSEGGSNSRPRVEIPRDDDGGCIYLTAGQRIMSHKEKYAVGVEVNYRIFDAESDVSSIQLEYSLDGERWQPG